MTRFLLGVLATGAFVLFTSFSFPGSFASRQAAPGPVWTSSSYRLDRAFRAQVHINPGTPLGTKIPADGGFVITQVRATILNGNISVAVNGATEDFIFTGTGAPRAYDLNPPIIAKPGDAVVITATAGTPTIIFAGYRTVPGET